MMTRWLIPAPRESMATMGAAWAWPAWLMGWQISSRQPSKLGCFRVATKLPSTRASSMAQKMLKLSTITQRRTRVKVPGLVTPSPVGVAMEKLR